MNLTTYDRVHTRISIQIIMPQLRTMHIRGVVFMKLYVWVDMAISTVGCVNIVGSERTMFYFSFKFTQTHLLPADDARHFSGKYIGQRLASQFIASGNLTVTNAFDKVMVCATYCMYVWIFKATHTHTQTFRAASPCRSFGVSESTGECELYLVDDTYALFATTWMSTNATWTIFIPE